MFKLLTIVGELKVGQDKLDKAIAGILNAWPVKDIPQPPRTKKNMNRKFKMKLAVKASQ